MLTCAHSVKSFVPSSSKSIPPLPVLPPLFASQHSGSPSPSKSTTIPLLSKHDVKGESPGDAVVPVDSPAASGEKDAPLWKTTEFDGSPQVKAGNSTAATPLT